MGVRDPVTVALTAQELRALMNTWNETHRSFMEAVQDAIEARTPKAIGDRVRSVYPNVGWGEGTVSRVVTDAERKRYAVTRDDGQVGWFNPEGITKVEPDIFVLMLRVAAKGLSDADEKSVAGLRAHLHRFLHDPDWRDASEVG